MSGNPIEIILSRQLADSLSMPIFIVDTAGNLIFYNEPAEGVLGLRFEDTGFMSVEEWSTIFKPQDDNGEVFPAEKMPLVQTLSTQKPAHGAFWINSLAGDYYHISVTSYPIIGRPDRFLGAVAIFWKSEAS